MTEPTIAEYHEKLGDALGEQVRQRLRAEKAERELTALQQRLAEANRRLLHMATTNSDDYRWFKQQAQQACRAIGIESEKLDWE